MVSTCCLRNKVFSFVMCACHGVTAQLRNPVMLSLEAKKPGLSLCLVGLGLGLVGPGLGLGLVSLGLGLVKYGLEASRGQEASSPRIKCKVEKSIYIYSKLRPYS